ncbi:Notch-regulated ankyrin repeat-containing protein [Plecturocebus cupreus]
MRCALPASASRSIVRVGNKTGFCSLEASRFRIQTAPAPPHVALLTWAGPLCSACCGWAAERGRQLYPLPAPSPFLRRGQWDPLHRELGIPRVARGRRGGTTSERRGAPGARGRRRRQRWPPRPGGHLASPTPARPATSAPCREARRRRDPPPALPCPAPPTLRPHVGAAQSRGRRRARHGLPLLCKYKEGKRSPGAGGERELRRVGRRVGTPWEPQLNRAGTGTARRRRPRPGPAPASRARSPVAHPGAAGCGRVPAAATPGPERPERPEAACGARGRRALHAPRRAPSQPGARAAAAARAEPRPGPRPAPGGSMSQAELSTCSAPQTQRIFQEAVRKGNTQELQSLLQNMTNCEFNVNSFGPEGQTALHQSVIDGNLELVKLLVKFGADIRLANRDGWSALHIAAFGGHQDIVLYLITKAKYAASGR